MSDTTITKAPKGSVAVALPGGSTWPGMPKGDIALLDNEQEVRALAWPTSIRTFEKIRRDAQAQAMFFGLTTPIRQYPWAIDPNGAEDVVVQKLAEDMSLPILGLEDAPIGRTRNRFNHDDHLTHCLLALLYGHMFYEQQGYVDDDLNWRLQKLFPIMPKTIGRIEVKSDGGLVGVRQNIYTQPGKTDPPLIKVGQLVGYIWNKEGANWFGRSMLTTVYRHWLIKDRLLRVDAVKHERTGAGVPIVEAPAGASSTEIARLDAMAQAFKIGESSGGAVPSGTKFRLVGVEGATSDVLASIRYQDEQMAIAFSQEVKTLGHSAYGSRALGQTFAHNAVPVQKAIAQWYARTTNEHVIEDWVDWNFGTDYGAPRIVHMDPKLDIPLIEGIDPNTLDPNQNTDPQEQASQVAAARQLLDATEHMARLASTEVAPGMAVLNLPEDQRNELTAAREWATGVLAKAS